VAVGGEANKVTALLRQAEFDFLELSPAKKLKNEPAGDADHRHVGSFASSSGA